MKKPSYRLQEILTTQEASIDAIVNLRSSRDNIEEKTFGCGCNKECDCNKECSCDKHCSCDSQCRHCRCDDYNPCKRDCQDYDCGREGVPCGIN